MAVRQTTLFGKVTKPANKKCDVKGGRVKKLMSW